MTAPRMLINNDGATNKSRLLGFEDCLVQLSDGAAVWLDNQDAALHYTTDRSTISSGLATALPDLAVGSYYHGQIMCRDASDNLYVLGTSALSSISYRIQVLVKGVGHTWTAKASVGFGGAGGLTTSPQGLVWCNTGGGTGGAGHLVALAYGSTSSDFRAYIFDAGALLANATNTVAAASSAAILGSTGVSNASIASDGFGGTAGIIAGVYNPGTNTLSVDTWSITSGGTFSRSALTGSATSVGTTSPVKAIRYASNGFAVIYQDSFSAGQWWCARYSTSARLTAPVASGAPTNLPLVSNSAPVTGGTYIWGVQNDPVTANTVRLFAQTTTGITIWQVPITLTSGVTWGTTATAETATVAGQGVALGIRLVKNPEYNGIGGAYGDWHVYTETTAGPTGVREDGDFHSYPSAPLAPTDTAPANASYVDVTAGVTYQFTYNPGPTSGALQAWSLRQKISGGSYLYWNAGTSAWQSTQVWNTSIATSVTITTGLSNGNVYNWAFATQEATNSLQGPFAADSTFTAQAPPTDTVTGPSGTITTTSTPTVTWTDTLPGGAVQTAYRVIIESGAYGTTPGAGAVAWDSGVVTSSATSATPAALTNSITYRAFVQVTETGGQTSPWAYSTFTLALTPPPTPTIAAAADNPNARIVLTVTAGVGGGPVPTYYTIERSDDAGATWKTVRAAGVLAYASSVTAYDYEAPPSEAARYRVRAVSTIGGNLVASPNSATATATVTLTSWWLKNTNTPTANRAICDAQAHQPVRPGDSVAIYPAGRKLALVLKGALHGATDTLRVVADGETAFTDMLTLFTANDPMLLQDPRGRQWYIDWVGDLTQTQAQVDRAIYWVQRNWVEVDVPG